VDRHAAEVMLFEDEPEAGGIGDERQARLRLGHDFRADAVAGKSYDPRHVRCLVQTRLKSLHVPQRKTPRSWWERGRFSPVVRPSSRAVHHSLSGAGNIFDITKSI